MKAAVTRATRRRFISGFSLTCLAAAVSAEEAERSVQASGPAVARSMAAAEGLLIPPTPDGRVVTIKIDSEVVPAARMSMITEDLPPNSEIRVHLHQREDEIIVIRLGNGVATLADREFAVEAGAIIYVPQGTWHGLRNDGTETLGMSATFSPAGFEQIFKDRLRRPNRTAAEAEATRKKFGIVYRK